MEQQPKSRAQCTSPELTRVTFWGVRGSIPTPGPETVIYGGNTTCVEVRSGSEIIILDAGTGLRPLGKTLAAEFQDQPLRATLLLSHTHWDHIHGLPFFAPVYRPQNRLRILGYEGAKNGLRAILASQMDTPYFPIGLREVPAAIQIEELTDMAFAIGDIQVQACRANHPGVCVGYRLFTPHGSIAFFPDHESRHGLYGGPGTPDTPGQRHDRQQDRRLADFLRGVDVLIMDAQYDWNEYTDHVGWGHGCVDDVVALATQAEAKHLFLFHHDPDHHDAKIAEMADRARRIVAEKGGNLRVDAAREGLTIELGGSEVSGCPPRTIG